MKALIVASNGPERTFGGGQRNLLVIRILEAKGYKVEMLLLINKAWGYYGKDSFIIQKWQNDFAMVKYFQPGFSSPYMPDMSVVNWLKNHQLEYDTIIFRDDVIAFKAGFYFLKKDKVIVDMNDFLLPSLSGFRRYKYKLLHQVLKARADRFWLLVPGHLSYFKKNKVLVPNLPLNAFEDNSSGFKKSRSAEPAVLFVGSYLSELISFLEEAEESLLLIDNIKIIIISRAITNEMIKKYNNPMFVWLNEVEDLTEYYSRAWISIAPGPRKGGTLIKIIESIYYSTPVAASIGSLNGYEVFNMGQVLIPGADNTADFVENIRLLLQDEAALDMRAEKLKSITKEHFSMESILKKDLV
jgi:glycosyltransferase involved in cell wall biosynthesis